MRMPEKLEDLDFALDLANKLESLDFGTIDDLHSNNMTSNSMFCD